MYVTDLAKFIDDRINPSIDVNCEKMIVAFLGLCLKKEEISALTAYLKELVLNIE